MLSHDDFDKMLDEIYRTGGNPEIVMTTLERAYAMGLIGRIEYAWRRVFRKLHIPQPNIAWRPRE